MIPFVKISWLSTLTCSISRIRLFIFLACFSISSIASIGIFFKSSSASPELWYSFRCIMFARISSISAAESVSLYAASRAFSRSAISLLRPFFGISRQYDLCVFCKIYCLIRASKYPVSTSCFNASYTSFRLNRSSAAASS